MMTFRAPSRDSAALRFSGSKRVGWRRDQVFPIQCVETYPMVGMSAIFGSETRKSIFCHYWRVFVSSLGFSAELLSQVPGLPSGRRVLRFLVRAGGSDFRQNCTSQLDFEINRVTLEVISSFLRLEKVSSWVQGRPRRSGEAQSSRMVA